MVNAKAEDNGVVNTGTMDDPENVRFAQYLFPALVDSWERHKRGNNSMMPWRMSVWIKVIEEQQLAGNAYAKRCTVVAEDLYCHQMNRIFTLGIVLGSLEWVHGGEQTLVALSNPKKSLLTRESDEAKASAVTFARSYVSLIQATA